MGENIQSEEYGRASMHGPRFGKKLVASENNRKMVELNQNKNMKERQRVKKQFWCFGTRQKVDLKFP